MRVHLVDGTFELFRAFFGAPSAVDRDGREVGATRGLLRSLAALLREEDVTHVAVAFDHVIESFRNQLFVGYKTSEGVEPALLAQFELAERAAHALGVVVWPMVEFEADDAMATAAKRYALDPRVEQVVLCSPDKDLAQCVQGDRIVCFDRMRKNFFNEAGVKDKFGVFPASIPDYLALVGDSADGIPGVPRWGAKSTAAVLARYQHLEAIPELERDWDVKVRGASALGHELRAHRDKALLYRQLATLRCDVPLVEAATDLEWRGARSEALAHVCEAIGDSTLMSRIDRWRTSAD